MYILGPLIKCWLEKSSLKPSKQFFKTIKILSNLIQYLNKWPTVSSVPQKGHSLPTAEFRCATCLFVAMIPWTSLHCRSAVRFSIGGLYRDLQDPLKSGPNTYCTSSITWCRRRRDRIPVSHCSAAAIFHPLISLRLPIFVSPAINRQFIKLSDDKVLVCTNGLYNKDYPIIQSFGCERSLLTFKVFFQAFNIDW